MRLGRRHQTAVQISFAFNLFPFSAHAHTRYKMDLNFYSDLTDGTGQPGDPEFLDAQAFNGFDTVQKVIAVILLNQTTTKLCL